MSEPVSAPVDAIRPPVDAAQAPGDDRRRLVLGTAISFGVAQLRVFVESLREHYSGDAMILIGWPGLAVTRYLASRRIDVVRVFQARSFSRSVHARRYFVYRNYLRARAARYDQVMLSDVRDVVFQRNPFDGITGAGCHFYLESASRTIGDDPTNSRWARGALTHQQADALARHRISCSGITIGGSAAMLSYLNGMAARVGTTPQRIYRAIGHGYDQAIHNFLVHLDPAIDGVVDENNGHIATMALEPRTLYRLDDDARIRDLGGRVFPVCHQYDRFPDIRNAIEARYGAAPGRHPAG